VTVADIGHGSSSPLVDDSHAIVAPAPVTVIAISE
jgi:hypothetical protein